MKKILIACESGFHPEKVSNPFAKVLADGLTEYGCEVDYGVDKFWHSPDDYDLLFLQWSEELFGWKVPSAEELEQLRMHFKDLHDKGVRTLVTCHNLVPHNGNELITEAYKIVYDNVDAIHHMGSYSYEIQKRMYPDKLHFIAPHPIYYDLKSMLPSKKECRVYLGLPKNRPVMLCFGAFRNDGERQMIYDVRKHFKDLTILAPRFLSLNLWDKGKHRPAPHNIHQYFLNRYIYDIRFSNDKLVDESDIKYYFGAADFLFIQRKKILNSGNLPLAFSAGLPVIGPSVGNVGTILEECQNVVFDPDKTGSILEGIEMMLAKLNDNLGYQNYVYAKENWNAAKICALIGRHITQLCR